MLVVALVHNAYKEGKGFPNGRKDDVQLYPAAWADPNRADCLSNLLAAGAVSITQQVGSFTPYQT